MASNARKLLGEAAISSAPLKGGFERNLPVTSFPEMHSKRANTARENVIFGIMFFYVYINKIEVVFGKNVIYDKLRWVREERGT